MKRSRILYRRNTEEIDWQESLECATLEESWKTLKNTVLSSMIYKNWKRRKKKIGYKDWWDKSCSIRKRKIKRIYRKEVNVQDWYILRKGRGIKNI